MPELTLYRKDGACSFVPHALLRHLAIPFKAIVMREGPDGYEAADGSLTHAEYLNINPLGYVPVLIVDGEVITEMPAILTMIAHLAPDQEAGREMLGRTPLEKARVVEWMAWLSGSLHSLGFAAFWREYRFVEEHSECYPPVKEKGRKVIKQCFERIDKRLKGRNYAVGDAFTVVDFNLYLFWRWGNDIGFNMKERFPHYGLVLQNTEKLDSIRGAVREEGLSLYA
ncbi:glutathione S-transferase [Macroventuria anomochaeta]|uniref:Glutathione S-transferase n=1 Tax=Macroventuria anomochaeta TaxID=301207 RepID=A0ACB6RR86_9PLEO|nr:glutathione S-transferase [Macroventuria anomochaeta]KAF2623787.1 glutathione S-transferase [Macroventuria anomochaeta]